MALKQSRGNRGGVLFVREATEQRGGKCVGISKLSALSTVLFQQVSRFHLTSVQKREHRILSMVVAMVTCYLLCWMPYGIVSLIATFGKPGMITPIVSIIPSILAKASTCVNPILYVLLNKQVRLCFCWPWFLYRKTLYSSAGHDRLLLQEIRRKMVCFYVYWGQPLGFLRLCFD